jgi:hypothetical protein
VKLSQEGRIAIQRCGWPDFTRFEVQVEDKGPRKPQTDNFFKQYGQYFFGPLGCKQAGGAWIALAFVD